MTARLVGPTQFQERVYAEVRTVPRGSVTTYGDLATRLCTSARAVGQALRCNPYAPEVPCHRVVAGDGSIGGFAGQRAGTKITEKITLLREEGVRVRNGRVERFTDVRIK